LGYRESFTSVKSERDCNALQCKMQVNLKSLLPGRTHFVIMSHGGGRLVLCILCSKQQQCPLSQLEPLLVWKVVVPSMVVSLLSAMVRVNDALLSLF
jgi:hypothetical protein